MLNGISVQNYSCSYTNKDTNEEFKGVYNGTDLFKPNQTDACSAGTKKDEYKCIICDAGT